MDLKVPDSLKVEHEELHKALGAAIQSGGKTGAAAQNVANLLHPHFVKEEEYAMPPLALLPALAAGKATQEMKAALVMTDKLKAELPQMLSEHQAIVGGLNQLKRVAAEEGKLEHAHFADKLMLHAQTEEQVLYPAAIVVGELLKSRLER